MTTSPDTTTVPCAGPEATAMLLCAPVIEPARSMAVPELEYGTVTPDRSATAGAAGVPTVRLTVAGAEVPPGPVAV